MKIILMLKNQAKQISEISNNLVLTKPKDFDIEKIKHQGFQLKTLAEGLGLEGNQTTSNQTV